MSYPQWGDRRAPAMTTIVAVAGPSVTGGPARPTRTRAGGEGSRRQPVRDGRDSGRRGRVGDATLLRPLLRSVVLHLTYPKFAPLASVINIQQYCVGREMSLNTFASDAIRYTADLRWCLLTL